MFIITVLLQPMFDRQSSPNPNPEGLDILCKHVNTLERLL